jgi:hypothetical protein
MATQSAILGAPEYGGVMAVQDRPEVVRVVPGARAEPALVALLAVVVLAGAAIWKPWASGSDAPARPLPAQIVVQPRITPRAATPIADAAIVTVTGDQPIAGLDILRMGLADAHRGWGVAAAYVPVTQIAVATRRRLSSVRPVVDWQSVEPGNRAEPNDLAKPNNRVELPAAGQAVATVALAVTWPSGRSPHEIRLFYRSPGVQNGPELSTRLRTREMSLVRPLPGIAMFAWQAYGNAVDTGDAAWTEASGVFYLPPSDPLPTRPRHWLVSGWPAGAYEFRVTDADGTSVIAFWLRGASG